jgi:hypothetical protein
MTPKKVDPSDCECDIGWKEMLVRFSPLATAVVLGLAGILMVLGEDSKIESSSQTSFATGLLVSSSILLGAWLATEVWYVHQSDRNRTMKQMLADIRRDEEEVDE